MEEKKKWTTSHKGKSRGEEKVKKRERKIRKNSSSEAVTSCGASVNKGVVQQIKKMSGEGREFRNANGGSRG